MLNRARDVPLRAFHSGCDIVSEREPGGDRRGECAPRAVYEPDVGARRRKLGEDPIVKQQVDRLRSMKMASFDHDGRGARTRQSAWPPRARRRANRPECRRAPRLLPHSGSPPSPPAGAASSVLRRLRGPEGCVQPCPPLAMTGSTTRFRSRRRLMPSATARTMSGVASMPVLTAAISTSCATRSICARTMSAGIARTSATPVVFWAVTAVTADTPYTPSAANVFRSA